MDALGFIATSGYKMRYEGITIKELNFTCIHCNSAWLWLGSGFFLAWSWLGSGLVLACSWLAPGLVLAWFWLGSGLVLALF